MRLLLKFIKNKYSNYYQPVTIKSIAYRVNRTSNVSEDISLRIRKFLRVLGLPLFLIKNVKKSEATAVIIDTFINREQQVLRTDFIKYFKPEYKDKDIAFLDGKSLYYNQLTISKIVEALGWWWTFLIISLISIFKKKDNYTAIHFDNIASNLINLTLLAPESTYNFHFYSPTTYITTLLAQQQHPIYISVSSSMLYSANRYSYLPDTHLIFCWDYHFEEYKCFEQFGWMQSKTQILWGPEEILEHNEVIRATPKYEIGIYGRGDWARDTSLRRETDIKKVKNYTHANNKHALFFRAMIETAGELTPSIKIYPHPFERNLYNDHNIKPAYWDLVEKYNIEIDFAGDNSIDTIYECKVGIGNITSIIMDRWGHGLEAFAAYNQSIDSNFCKPKYLGKYQDNFFTSTEELSQLVKRKLSK